MSAESEKYPLRVLHFPQVPCKPFAVAARTMDEAVAIAHSLAMQHLYLFEGNFIPDYSNAIMVEEWDGEEWLQVDESDDPYVTALASFEEFAGRVERDKP